MIPAAFDYTRPRTEDEAFALLQQHGADARVLAGGQSLIPAMRFRLARPSVLVDINSLATLDYVRTNGALVVGALARDAAIERAPWIADRRWSLLHDVSRVVADPVVRQMATVVGSLCHNDPAGDWTTAALAARAELIVRGKSGPRTVRIDDFLVDSFTTAVQEGEMAIAVRFPLPDDRTAGSYQKVERKVGDFATAAVAVHLKMNGGVCERVGIGLTNVGFTPIKAVEAEAALTGQAPDDAHIAQAAQLAADASQPLADYRGTEDYKRSLVKTLTARAIRLAAARAQGGH